MSSPWITETNLGQQRMAAVLISLAGGLLVWGFRHAQGSLWAGDGEPAGFWLGIWLLPIGVGTLLLGGKTTITVDPRRRLITVARVNALRERRRVVRFNDIAELLLGELGDDESGSTRYYVVARLKTGKDLPLFHGFFDGSTQREAMEARRVRLWQMIQTPSTGSDPAPRR
jgi:hypothetical protein